MTRSAWAFRAAVFALAVAVSGCTDKEEAKRKHLEQGNAHMAAGRTQEAIIQYRNAIKVDRRFGEAHLRLGEAYLKSKALPQAAKSFMTAAELLPEDVDAQLKAATIRLLGQDFQGARGYAEAALKAQPKNVQAQVILATALAGLKDISAALQQLEEAIRIAPGDARPFTSLGAIYVSQGDKKLAEDAFRKAVAADPNSVFPRVSLGYYLWALNRPAEAEVELKKAVELGPDDASANRMLSYFYFNQNRASDAETPLLRLANQKDPTAMQTLADLYIRTGRPANAKSVLEALKEDATTRTFAATRLAQIDYTAGRTKEAHNAIQTALKADPNNAEFLSLEALWFLAERRMGDALNYAKKAEAAAPESANVQYALGMVHAGRDENQEAIRAFTEVLRLNPRATAAELQLSRLLLVEGQVDQGVIRARAVVKATPGSVDGRIALATALLGRKDIAGAEAEVKTLLKDSPDNAAVHSLYGYILAQRGDSAGSIHALDRALELNPANLHALYGRLALDLQLGRTADARARMQRAFERGPLSADLLVMAARLENSAKDPKAAEKYLRHAIDLEPDDISAYSLLGEMYVRQNRLEDAKRELEEVARRRPENVAARTMIGIILEVQGKPEESQKVYEALLGSTSRAPVAANNLAYIYAQRGERLNEALTLAQKAKEQMPGSHEISDTLGWVYYRKDMASLAIRPFRESIERAPNNPLYHYHLGLAYSKTGETAKARQSLEQALKLNAAFPGADDARKTLASLKE